MSPPDPDPAKRPLLFPDPVIEFYMERVDRAVIRAHLKKTPTERLNWLQKKADEEALTRGSVAREESPPWPARKNVINVGADPAWSARAKAVPLLVSDPVIEAYLEDVDRGLIRQALRLSVPERFDKFHRLIVGAHTLRRACAKKGP